MAIRFLKIAVVYLAVGVAAGLLMGITQQFQYAPVHAHLNLLGWATLALASLIYHQHPAAASTRLAQWHFWLHNLGLPLFMLGLFFRIGGHEQADTAIKVGALLSMLGIQLFTVNLLRSVRAGRSA